MNRIENLCRNNALIQEIQHAGDIWRKDQSYIQTVNGLLPSQQQEIESLRKASSNNEKMISALSEKLKTAQQGWDDTKKYNVQLSEQLAAAQQQYSETEKANFQLTEQLNSAHRQFSESEEAKSK